MQGSNKNPDNIFNKLKRYGIEDTTMKNLIENKFGNITVIERVDYTWGIIDSDGNEIVPFGKYNWIDRFDHGLARVKIGTESSNTVPNNNKWGIINEKGEEVLPVEYDNIWNFVGKNRISTDVVKNGKETEIFFCDLTTPKQT